jgi:hypothetical protein
LRSPAGVVAKFEFLINASELLNAKIGTSFEVSGWRCSYLLWRASSASPRLLAALAAVRDEGDGGRNAEEEDGGEIGGRG